MDFLTKKEIEGLKQDIQSKEIAIEADKYMFEHKLLNGLGESMMNELKNPTKPNWFTGLKLKYARWKTIRREKRNEEKERRQLLKQLNNNIKKEMGGF